MHVSDRTLNENVWSDFNTSNIENHISVLRIWMHTLHFYWAKTTLLKIGENDCNCLISWIYPPPTVTCSMITFLVGNTYKPLYATIAGWGVDASDIIVPRTPMSNMGECDMCSTGFSCQLSGATWLNRKNTTCFQKYLNSRVSYLKEFIKFDDHWIYHVLLNKIFQLLRLVLRTKQT